VPGEKTWTQAFWTGIESEFITRTRTKDSVFSASQDAIEKIRLKKKKTCKSFLLIFIE